MQRFKKWMSEALSIDNAWWGAEITGPTIEVIAELRKHPPTSKCTASVEFPKKLTKEAVETHHARWGDELTGFTGEVIKSLSSYPAQLVCTASVENGATSPNLPSARQGKNL